MTVYLSIRSDERHSRAVLLTQLDGQLSVWPELRKVDAGRFEVIRGGAPCAAWLEAFACSCDGGYAVFKNDPPPVHVNLLELRYSYGECGHCAWFDALVVRVAQSLGWQACGVDEDGNDLQLWPLAS